MEIDRETERETDGSLSFQREREKSTEAVKKVWKVKITILCCFL